MITFRRELLDWELKNSAHLMEGRALDIGGSKKGRRGSFSLPTENIQWEYLNSDATADPDYCCSAEKIPLENNCINTVLMTEVLEYIDNPQAALSEIFRILAPGGICIMTIPFLHAVHGDWQEDRQRFTAQKLKELSQKVGFRKIDVRPMGGLGSVVFDLVHVAAGYADPERKSFVIRVVYKLFRLLTPLFRMIDCATRAQQEYINTGYFVVMGKGQADGKEL